jgi:hypothetical protein
MTKFDPVFTKAQIAKFQNQIEENIPPFPVSTDRDTNPHVRSLTTAGGPAGLLLNFQTDKGLVKLYCNPAVAWQLMVNIIHANTQTPWWDEKGIFLTKD